MTPAARVQAAIEALDKILAGAAAEQVLTNWGRAARYAGSGDRAAVRDHVFTALRQRQSAAALGGGATGRGLMLGLLRAAGIDPAGVFTGAPYAPAALTAPEAALATQPVCLADLPEAVALDCPDWLLAPLRAALGEGCAPSLAAMRDRAPLFLRANTLWGSREDACALLAEDGVDALAHPLAPTALEVRGGETRLRASRAMAEGAVEVQDAASQALVEALPLQPGWRVLDYCAGGGGKTLALGARAPVSLVAHDANPARMRDLQPRARRAGLKVREMPTAALPASAFDLVLVDAPCSGSGTWRRQPEAKWALTPQRLADLAALQGQILDTAMGHVGPGGVLAYATCSLLQAENEAVADAFVHRHGWICLGQHRFGLAVPDLAGGDMSADTMGPGIADGLFVATFRAPGQHR